MITKKTRIKYFQELGLGEYNNENIKKLQSKYFARKQDVDGIYGKNTDILLRNLYRVDKYTKHFKLEEFKCECGGKYCTGYPQILDKQLLLDVEQIRSDNKKSLQITCGLRCQKYNDSLVGSIRTSAHIKGKAVDFYMKDRTETLKQRTSLIKKLKKLKKHKYSYGDGISSSGKVSAPNMGNAVHFEVK